MENTYHITDLPTILFQIPGKQLHSWLTEKTLDNDPFPYYIMPELKNMGYTGKITVISSESDTTITKEIYIIDGKYMYVNDIINKQELYHTESKQISNGITFDCITSIWFQHILQQYDIDNTDEKFVIQYLEDNKVNILYDPVITTNYFDLKKKSVEEFTRDQIYALNKYENIIHKTKVYFKEILEKLFNHP